MTLGMTWSMAVIPIATPSICAFAVIFFGYTAQTSFLQYVFYQRMARSVQNWKIQSDQKESITNLATRRTWNPILGLAGDLGLLKRKQIGLDDVGSKLGRAKYHNLFATVNLITASLFALSITELSVQSKTNMVLTSIDEYGLPNVILDFMLAVLYQSVLEYYWHRLMHTKQFYATFHKYHHHYKSPEPYDDMYIHPLEAFGNFLLLILVVNIVTTNILLHITHTSFIAGYYCILYSYPIFFNTHYIAFIAYMIVMGLAGVLDHSGIRFYVPFIYSTCDHDLHHKKFDVNYAFPFPFMDMIHGTYSCK